MGRIVFYGTFALLAFSGVFLFIATPNTFVVAPEAPIADPALSPHGEEQSLLGVLLPLPEAPTVSSGIPLVSSGNNGDSGIQGPLSDSPRIAKAVYLTGWSAGSASRVESIIALIQKTELNAVVIDIKDYSGHVSYRMDIPLVREIGADQEIKIVRPNALIKKLHENGIYVIGRITVFQDPILARAKPEWALHDTVGGGVWRDRKGLPWMDPAAEPVWAYNTEIAKDALLRGFDEVNFDYIRFASDGDLSRIGYPFWDERSSRRATIRTFFAYVRKSLAGATISADLFGLATVNEDDLGIGQVIEDAYEYFDYVAPMVYPSHYAKGFIGLENPGANPYEVMKYSLDRARVRRDALAFTIASTTGVSYAEAQATIGKLRPWIQDFDLGADYTAEMVRKEFQATYDALRTGSGEAYAGWYLWDPANTYTEGALESAEQG